MEPDNKLPSTDSERIILVTLTVYPEYTEFAVPELKTVLRRLGQPLKHIFSLEIPENQYPQHEHQVNEKSFKNFPYLKLRIPEFERHRKYLADVCKKSIMISDVILLFASGANYEEMIANKNEELLKQESRSWDTQVMCKLHSYNRSIAKQSQVTKINQVFQKLGICGKVNFKNPEKIYQLVELHKWFQKHHLLPESETLLSVHFGLTISHFREGSCKSNNKYELKNRIYLGPTTTDNDLAFLMCHQANVSKNSFVLDPFVGTGGLLIPPAHYGAQTFGSDLDSRVLNGYSVGKINTRSTFYNKEKKLELFTPKITLNFEQYGLVEPNILRMDCINGGLKCRGYFDAIICDPPYGIRAMSRSMAGGNKTDAPHELSKYRKPKAQKNESQEKSLQKEQQQQHHQSTQNHALEQESSEGDSVDDIADDAQKSEEKQIHETTPVAQKTADSSLGPNGKPKPIHIVRTTSQELLFKKKKKETRRANKKKRFEALPEEEKQAKKELAERLCQEIRTKWANKPKIQITSKQDIFKGLLNFAEQYLRVGGYFVYLYPIMAEENYTGDYRMLPSHECFELLDYSSNMLSQGHVRVLVTMRKTRDQINTITTTC